MISNINLPIFLLGISLFFGILFFGFSVLVKRGTFTKIDFDTTVRLQNHTPKKIDTIFPLFGALASFPIMALILMGTLVIVRKWSGSIVLFVFLLSHGVEVFGKLYINHPPPPFLFYKHLDAPDFSLQKYYVSGGSSYPSGHEFRSVFVGILILFLMLRSHKRSRIQKILISVIILITIFFVGVSRVSLGEHWTSDVIGGALFGAAMGTVGVLFL